MNKLGLALGTALKFYTTVEKGLKVKVRRYWRLIPTFIEVAGKKVTVHRYSYSLLFSVIRHPILAALNFY